MAKAFIKTTVTCNTCKKLVDKDHCVAIYQITQSLTPIRKKEQWKTLYCCLDCYYKTKPGYYALHPYERFEDLNISQLDMFNDLCFPPIDKGE